MAKEANWKGKVQNYPKICILTSYIFLDFEAIQILI